MICGGTNNLKIKILSDLGGVQEADWNESEIQAALLDELVLHLEMTFRNEEEMSERSHLINNARKADHGVDISSVRTLGVHSSSLHILLIIWTDGDDDQSWRLVQKIMTESALAEFPRWIVLLTYIQEVAVQATDGAVPYVHLQNQVQGRKWSLRDSLETSESFMKLTATWKPCWVRKSMKGTTSIAESEE